MCMETVSRPAHRRLIAGTGGDRAIEVEPKADGTGKGRWDDYCTMLLVVIWLLLCTALYLDYRGTPLWVVLAGLMGYTCLSLGLNVLLCPHFKLRDRSVLAHSLVSMSHVVSMAMAGGVGSPPLLKLALSCGYLTFSLWEKTLRRLYASSLRRFVTLFQEAVLLILSVTCICKDVRLDAGLLVGLPALPMCLEALEDVCHVLQWPPSDRPSPSLFFLLLHPASSLLFRLCPHALLLLTHAHRLLLTSQNQTYPAVLLPTQTYPAVEVDPPRPLTWPLVVALLLLTLCTLDLLSLLAPLLTPSTTTTGSNSGNSKGGGGKKEIEDAAQLWFVHGKAYDLRAYMDKHPGGWYALRLGQGRDCTALFESYHPFTTRHRQVLRKFEVQVAPDVLAENCVVKGERADPFYDAIKRRAFEVLVNRRPWQEVVKGGREREGEGEGEHDIQFGARGGGEGHGRAQTVASLGRRVYYVSMVGMVVWSYLHYLRGRWWALPIFGLCSWLMGAMGHDGAHFAVGRSPKVNALAGWGISLICSPLMWYHQHTFGHHSFTNDVEHDPDLHHFSFLRLHESYPYDPMYRHQVHWWYIYLHYGLVAFGETVWIPMKLMSSGTIHGIVNLPHMGVQGLLAGLAHFVPYLYLIVYLPASRLGGLKAVLFPLLYVFQCGLYFGLFSQINHLSEQCIHSAGRHRGEAKEGEEKKRLDSWAAEQVETSANFAPQSWLWFLLSNGLNMQIEHHLLPSVNHEHLALVQPVVEATCLEFGVSYKSYPTFADIFRQTVEYYGTLATPEK